MVFFKFFFGDGTVASPLRKDALQQKKELLKRGPLREPLGEEYLHLAFLGAFVSQRGKKICKSDAHNYRITD